MADVSANLVVIAVQAPTASAAATQGGAVVAGPESGPSFGQHVIDNQAGAKAAVNEGPTAAEATVSDGTDGSAAGAAVQTVQVPTVTPAPAVTQVQVSGSAQDLAALSARMQALVAKLQNLQPPLDLNTLTGSAGDAKQLTAALQQLGASPSDAAALAGKITGALKAFKTKLSGAGVDTDKLSGAALGTTPGGEYVGANCGDDDRRE